MDWEAMINYIKNGDQQLPRITQASIAGTSSTKQPPLKDKSMWSDQEKKIQKIERLARSFLIQGLSNDIYSLIDNRKVVVLYEYETFKATEGELLLDTYIGYLQYATMMRQNKNLMDINIDALYNILKQNQRDVNDVMGLKKKTVVVTSDPLALIAEKIKLKMIVKWLKKNVTTWRIQRNALCNARMNASVDVNDFFVFDDVSIRKSHVSKMPFRKKPHDSLNIVQICLWIIDSGCSKHMTGNRSLLTNFVEKFSGTVRFGNNDFAMIAGYGDV
nr:integrase, catalytic region, zinc finger, CCHC-type, peptidase aspartic, catalytic [Tanacetum cinerariifolium]